MLPRYSRYVSSSKGHVWKHQLFQLSRFNLCPNWTPNTLPQLQLVPGPEASWLSGMAQPVTDHQAMTENYVGPCGTMWDHQPINANKIFRFFSVIRVIRVINANPWRLPTYACQSDSNDPRSRGDPKNWMPKYTLPDWLWPKKKGMGPQGLSFLSAKPSKFGTKTWNHYHTLDGKSSRTVKKFPEGIEGIPGSRLLLDPFGTMAMNHLEKRCVKNPLAIEEI